MRIISQTATQMALAQDRAYSFFIGIAAVVVGVVVLFFSLKAGMFFNEFIGFAFFIGGAVIIASSKREKLTLDKANKRITYQMESIITHGAEQFAFSEVSGIKLSEIVTQTTRALPNQKMANVAAINDVAYLVFKNGTTVCIDSRRRDALNQGSYNGGISQTVADFLGVSVRTDVSVGVLRGINAIR